MTLHNPDADRERIASTQTARQTANSTALWASEYLRQIAIASSIDGETFARLQQGQQNLGSAITLLASVRASVDELDALLPKIAAEWAIVPEASAAGLEASEPADDAEANGDADTAAATDAVEVGAPAPSAK